MRIQLALTCWGLLVDDATTFDAGITVSSLRALAVIGPDRVDAYPEAHFLFTCELALVDIWR
jgi:hypothetical protein